MSKRCLLLRFPDNREVFTHEKYQSDLVEFIKVFNVKLFTVEANSPSLLNIKAVIKIFCDHNKDNFEVCSYRMVGDLPSHDTSRESVLKKVSDIRSYIENIFLQGNVVRIKELHHHFIKHNIAVSTIYRHLSYVKDKLIQEGKKIEKIATGCYKLT